MHILEVQNLVKRFGGVAAVNGCSFEVERNSITALIGPNGAGKTTMFDLISGLLKHDGGDIIFKGDSIAPLRADKRANLGISRTFQAIRVFPQLSALDNVILGLRENPDGFGAVFRSFSPLMKTLKEKAFELLSMVNLHDKARAPARSLSYGQQKLLEIIRAVATNADLFLLDEPAAGVNKTMLHAIIKIIKRLKDEGKTIIIVEHDMGFVMSLCEKVIVMDYGKEIAQGRPEEIQKNPKVLEAYLGVKHQFHAHH